MDTRKIKKLIELVKETGIGELEVKSGEESVRINATSSPSTPAMTPPSTIATPHSPPITMAASQEPVKKEAKKTPEGYPIKSPMVGTVYLATEPGAAPFVAVGQHVETGDVLCLIEAMKMFNKIEADRSGTLSARLVDNEQPVEYDQPLFIIDTDK